MTTKGDPTVELEFLVEMIKKSKKQIEIVRSGNTICYILRGTRPLSERTVYIRNEKGEVDFLFATSVAYKFKFMSELLEWFLKNKNWKDGAYII